MSGSGTPTWSVLTMACERPDVMVKFVSWHVEQGASEIIIFFDDPEDPCIELMKAIPQVRAVPCTHEFWVSIGMHSDVRFTKRQTGVLTYGYGLVRTDWVAMIDADELIWSQEPVAALLQRQPDTVRAIRFGTLEAANTDDGEIFFRAPQPVDVVQDVHGDFAPHLVENRGLVGHRIGKSITRAGLEVLKAHPHWMVAADGERLSDQFLSHTDGAALLHLYAPQFEDWFKKSRLRMTYHRSPIYPELAGLIDKALKTGDVAEVATHFSKLHGLTEEQEAKLHRAGLGRRLDLQLGQRVKRVFPDYCPETLVTTHQPVRVVSVVKESLAVIKRFVAWYLDQGVQEIMLFFDDPNDPVAAHMEGQKQVVVYRCDEDFWRAHGQEPAPAFTTRQNAAATIGYQKAEDGWVLFVDADEIVHLGEQTLAEFASSQPQYRECIRFLPAEMVYVRDDPKSWHMRLPMQHDELEHVYRNSAEFFRHRHGLISHAAGKSMTRARLEGVTLRQHWPVKDARPMAFHPVGTQDNVHLLHFVADSFLDWRSKLEWRIGSSGYRWPVRNAVQRAYESDQPDEHLIKLYRLLYHLGPMKLRRLKRVGKYRRFEIDFDAIVARHFSEDAS